MRPTQTQGAGTDLTTLSKSAPTPPRVIAHKSRATRGELLVQPEAYREFRQQQELRDDAADESDLYTDTQAAHCSHKVLRCPSQKESRLSVLRAAFGYAHQQRVSQLRRRGGLGGGAGGADGRAGNAGGGGASGQQGKVAVADDGDACRL